MVNSNDYTRAMKLIHEADYVLVSASNGLSIAEGYHIFADNDAFKRYFGEFRERYDIHSILQGIFAPLPPKARAAFQARLYQYMAADYRPSSPMQALRQLLRGKDYFIVTSNGDTHFQLNGFPSERLFEVEGNFFTLREGDSTWEKQHEAMQSFLQRASGRKTVVLELGIGARNQLIKAPLMELVAREPKFSYITLNMPQEINIPEAIAPRSLAIVGDIAQTLQALAAHQ